MFQVSRKNLKAQKMSESKKFHFQYKVRIFDKKEKTLRGYFTRLSGYSQSLSPKFVYLHALQCATTQGRVWYALPCARHLFLTANCYVLPCTSNRDCETYQEVTHGFYGAPLTLAVFVPLVTSLTHCAYVGTGQFQYCFQAATPTFCL